MGAVDDVQRPIVLAALACDDEYIDLARLQEPDGVLAGLGDPDELERRVVRAAPAGRR